MIRSPTPEEAKAVVRFFEGFEEGLSVDVFGDLDLAVVETEGEDYLDVVLVPEAILGAPVNLWQTADHAGLRIGSLDEGGFALDLQGAVRMAAYTRKQAVRVSEQSARLFLYGKDVLGSSVKSFDPRLDPGDVCVVCNPRWEAIGLGEVMGRFKGDRPAVHPIHDLGTYLRDQDRD